MKKDVKKIGITLACAALLGGVVLPATGVIAAPAVYAEDTATATPSAGIHSAAGDFADTEVVAFINYYFDGVFGYAEKSFITPGDWFSLTPPYIEGYDIVDESLQKLTYEDAVAGKSMNFYYVTKSTPTPTPKPEPTPVEQPLSFTINYVVDGVASSETGTVEPGSSATVTAPAKDGYAVDVASQTITYDQVKAGGSLTFNYTKVQLPRTIIAYHMDNDNNIVLSEDSYTLNPGESITVKTKTFAGYHTISQDQVLSYEDSVAHDTKNLYLGYAKDKVVDPKKDDNSGTNNSGQTTKDPKKDNGNKTTKDPKTDDGKKAGKPTKDDSKTAKTPVKKDDDSGNTGGSSSSTKAADTNTSTTQASVDTAAQTAGATQASADTAGKTENTKSLPNTGDDTNILASLMGLGLLASLGLAVKERRH